MDADKIIQELGIEIYQPPLSLIREEAEFPDLDNPLHLIVLLVDCDTEISMNGMLGFLENLSGQHLGKTIEALDTIGAAKSADLFRSVERCMTKHGVTWAKLRGDFEGSTEYQITSFRELHGDPSTVSQRRFVRLKAAFHCSTATPRWRMPIGRFANTRRPELSGSRMKYKNGKAR